MAKFIQCIFIFFVGLFISGCDMLDKYPSEGREGEPIKKGIKFEIKEAHNPVDQDLPIEPDVAVIMITEDIYPCANYRINSEGSLGGKNMHVQVSGADLPGNVCLTALGPAAGWQFFSDIKPGSYEVSMSYKQEIDWFKLTVTDISLVVEGKPNFFKPETRRNWRYPERSFVYRCNLSSDSLDKCREFQQDILTEKYNLSPFSFPAGGAIPFDLRNAEITAFYRYEDESTYDKIGNALLAYADTAIDAKRKVRMSVENWLAIKYEGN